MVSLPLKAFDFKSTAVPSDFTKVILPIQACIMFCLFVSEHAQSTYEDFDSPFVRHLFFFA